MSLLIKVTETLITGKSYFLNITSWMTGEGLSNKENISLVSFNVKTTDICQISCLTSL